MTFDNGVLHTEKSCIFLALEVVGTSSICCKATTFPTSLSHLGPARLWASTPLALPCNPFVHPAPLLPLSGFLYAYTFGSHYCFFAFIALPPTLLLLPSTFPPAYNLSPVALVSPVHYSLLSC